MTIESTRAALLAIEEAHQGDSDGGHRLVSALCDYRSQMPEHATGEWDQVALSWVRDGAGRFWSVALGAMAQVGGPRVNHELASMLREPSRDAEWRGWVLNTLIRRGVTGDEVRAEVEEAARSLDPMGLPNIAALLALDPDALTCASDCVVTALASGDWTYPESVVPPFVIAAASSDPGLLVRLVQQAMTVDSLIGRRFGRMVTEYLRKPFVQSRFPEGVAEATAERLGSLVFPCP